MTFSILVFDQKTGIYAAAAATGSLCVGGWVLRGDIESGLVASQGTAPSTFWRDDIMRRMYDGVSAASAIEHVTAPDGGRDFRQVAALDRKGGTAAFTGANSVPFASHRLHQGMVIAGNMLTGPKVLDAMQQAAHVVAEKPAKRVLSALNAGMAAGGDNRGVRSAALLVLYPDAPPLDLRIDCSDTPIAALELLWAETRRAPYCDWLSEVPVVTDKTRRPR